MDFVIPSERYIPRIRYIPHLVPMYPHDIMHTQVDPCPAHRDPPGEGLGALIFPAWVDI